MYHRKVLYFNETSSLSHKTTGASTEVPPPAIRVPVFGLGDKFKKPEGSWDCDVCLVQNKDADLQCVACQATKPGAKVEPKGNKTDQLVLVCHHMLIVNNS